MLRRPLPAGQTDDVFFDGRSFAQENDISVVLLDSAITDDRQLTMPAALRQVPAHIPWIMLAT
jgi:hypothetical protein